MLISTLPSLHNRDLIKEMFSHNLIGGVRYNIGVRSKYTPDDTIHILNKYAETYDKLLWIDLKGRQLRITKWADPTYGDIELNREITVDTPAEVCFRGDEHRYVLDDYEKNKLFISPDPLHALGAGQALNIIGKNLNIIGNYLTPTDILYIKSSRDAGVHNYMLSFTEKLSDVQEVISIDADARPLLKIESVKGLEFVDKEYNGKYNLIAARDDLSTNLLQDKNLIRDAVFKILSKDKSAIVASNIFNSLKSGVGEDGKDITDLITMGYDNFMLDDTISHRYFKAAMELWYTLVLKL